MAREPQSFLIQKIESEGGEVPLSLMSNCNFIETFDLSGPILILDFSDEWSLIRDDLGIKEGSELTVTVADVWQRDEVDLEIPFTVETMPVNTGNMKINCFQSDIAKAKTKSKESNAFVDMSPGDIVQDVTGLSCKSGSFSSTEPYHLMAGERPSLLMRQIARESGACCYYNCRDMEMVFESFDRLMNGPKIEYSWDDRNAENQILRYEHLNVDRVIRERVKRSYTGWSLTEGRLKSGGDGESVRVTGIETQATLDALSKVPVPVLDFYCYGNGELRPGIPVDLIWNMAKGDAPIDESLPEQVLAGIVTHNYRDNFYYCRVRGYLLSTERAV